MTLAALQREESVRSGEQLPQLVEQCANAQLTRILSGDYNLKIARQDYFTANQEKVSRCSRLLHGQSREGQSLIPITSRPINRKSVVAPEFNVGETRLMSHTLGSSDSVARAEQSYCSFEMPFEIFVVATRSWRLWLCSERATRCLRWRTSWRKAFTSLSIHC